MYLWVAAGRSTVSPIACSTRPCMGQLTGRIRTEYGWGGGGGGGGSGGGDKVSNNPLYCDVDWVTGK